MAIGSVGSRCAQLSLLLLLGCNPQAGSSEHAREREPARQSPASAAPAPSTVAPARLDVVEVTTGGARRDEKLALIIALHGLGDRPESFARLFVGLGARARILLPRAPDAWGEGRSWFPFRAADGDPLRSRGISGAAERVASEIPRWVSERPTSGKPVVTGFSQGGMLTLAIAAQHPALISSGVAIGGALPEPLWPSLDAARPAVHIVALHGQDDDLVPIEPTRRGIDALVARGFDARLEAFPGVGHHIPSEMRARLFELLALELARAPQP